ncbi:MAG: hypothetical protein LJE97_13890 [Betaproteobacteria bacterium]|jgi:hypothetical protein|nr:hypothetical protein [Betaproteobacteria bacterium]
MRYERASTARAAVRWVAWMVVLLGCAASAVSHSAELACHRAGIVVTGDATQDLPPACAGVRDALAFLEPSGLTLERGPAIRLVDQLPAASDKHALGRYDPRSGVVELLDYRAAVSASECGPRAFKIPMSRTLWQSYVAHEVAHATVRAHDVSHTLRIAQYEYVAAVVQLGTLPDAIRSEILRNYDEFPAFGDASEISDLYYFMAPCAFAVKSYRHYLKPGNGPAFISGLILTAPRRP